jgi:DNA gyrase inhibitor GyrI
LRQKQGAKMKRGRTSRNKIKVAKFCTWEAAADLNPNSERERQNPHHSPSTAADETCGCYVTMYSMIEKRLCSSHSVVNLGRVILLKQVGCMFYL